MDSRVAAELIPPVYEDFDPSSEMVHEKDFDTILINLPGFRKDHLKVQLTTSKILRVSGSRLAENNKWRRFQKEFPVTPGRDPQRISAKFEGGILYIKVPMMIPTTPTPAVNKEEKDNKQVIDKSPITTPPEKVVAADEQKKPAQKNDSNTTTKVEESPKEKKVEKIPEDKRSNINAGVADNNKKEDQENKKFPEDQKNNSVEKPEGDTKKVKNQPEEKTRDLDDIRVKKSVAEGDYNEKLDKKAADNKRDKDSSETTTHRGDENENLALKLKKHRRMFNLALVTILALAIGIYVSDLFKSLRRRIQN